MKWRLIALLSMLALATISRADEIRLKNGSKIVGTIVAYQNGSFKIQTSYGFAMVRKDSIAAIIPSEPEKSAASKPAAEKGKAERAASRTAPAGAAERAPAAAEPVTTAPRKITPMKPPKPLARHAPMPAPAPQPASSGSPAPLSAVAPAAKPAPPAPEPPPVRELVRGNQYINETYGFQMYRPPDWDLMPGARRALPNAVAALGTFDQQTLLVIGRSPSEESLQAQAADTQRALRQIYDNYRPLTPLQRTSVSGLPAIEQQFRGLADGHDWWVSAVTVQRGGDMFTILGMTYADSDLIQIQENVIARAIASLQFNPEK
jgi:hypothetical protein